MNTSTMPFGKYRGIPLTELDNGYLAWLAGKLPEWRPPLRAAVEAEVARRKAAPAATRSPSTTETVCDKCGLGPSAASPLVLMHRRCVGDGLGF